MSHIADWLTAIGHNYFIVIIGTVEILAAVMLITENLMRRIRKKTTIDKKEIEAEMLRELDEREKEACILLRRSDMNRPQCCFSKIIPSFFTIKEGSTKDKFHSNGALRHPL